MSKLHLIITGGTIDSVFDASRDMVVVNSVSVISEYFKFIKPQFEYTQELLTLKDSRDITDNIRSEILASIEKAKSDKILITHGTYTMPETALYLQKHLQNSNKTIVLTGSMLPLQGFSPSDAPFNLGFAIASLFLAAPGVHLAMNGRLFLPEAVRKNTELGVFEEI